MKVLVIGGTRFMGIDTVERLLERGHEVTIYNRGTRPGLWPGRVRELRGDRADPRDLQQLRGADVDGVIDFCAYTARDTRALLYILGNVPRFVHISSGTVYQLHPHLPWSEDTPYGPAPLWGTYAHGKIECEQLLREERPDATATTVIRAPWVLGPKSYADREKFVLNRLIDGEEIFLPGDGNALQHFVSTRQIAHSIVAALESFDRGWRAFNVASPGYVSLEGVVRVCASIVNVEPRFHPIGGGPTGTASSAFDMANPVFPFPNEHYLLDLTASEKSGVAPPPVTLETMIEDALADLNTNPEQRSWRRTPAELSLLSTHQPGLRANPAQGFMRTERPKPSTRVLVGLMCGTSGDGVSAALVETEGYGSSRRVRMLAHAVCPYPDDLRQRLFRLFPPHQFSAEELAFLHRDVGELLAEAALEIIRRGGHTPVDVTAIAMQGPTVFHGPPSVDRIGVHMEIGEAAIVAEQTGSTVVSDLRPSDVAAGGHGAPLSAYADYVLFVDPARGRAIQNIGGIANVTFVPAAAPLKSVLSFDTGPGNMVIDGVVQQLTNGQGLFDEDGRRAAQGSIHGGLLTELMQHPYLAKHPPKTTGREDFGEPFVIYALERARALKIPQDDIVTTVTAYTAECIRLHYARELVPRGRIDEMIIYGGGAHNKTLLRMIQERLAPIRVRLHEEFGIPGDAREAVTWAILGDETLAGNAGNVPSASGARHRVVLGKIVNVRPRGES